MQPGGSLPLLGTGVALAASVGVACVTVALRSISRTESTPTIVFWFTIFSIAATGLLMPWFGQWHDARTWALLVALGLCGGLGQLFLTASLRFAPIATLAPIDYIQLVYSVALGWLIWSAQPGWTTWVGAGVIIASVLATFWMNPRREQPDPAGPAVGEA
jgi:drug/metabolite transporter (DMT)-like permease